MPATDPPGAAPRRLWLLAGLYAVGGVVGFVIGIFETIDLFQGESHNVAVSWGGGASTWAMGRGLLKGSGWAYRWAKRLAWSGLFAMVVAALIIGVAPGAVQVDVPGFTGELSRTDPRLIGGVASVFLLFLWQAVMLRSESVRSFFTASASEKDGDATAEAVAGPASSAD